MKYEQKYGHAADTCFVHGQKGEEFMVDEIKVIRDHTVLEDHFWIGVAE
jgi:hypothetical protein